MCNGGTTVRRRTAGEVPTGRRWVESASACWLLYVFVAVEQPAGEAGAALDGDWLDVFNLLARQRRQPVSWSTAYGYDASQNSPDWAGGNGLAKQIFLRLLVWPK